MRITSRIKHAWDAFTGDDIRRTRNNDPSSSRASHRRVSSFDTSSYKASIFNRIAIDVSMTKFKHVKVNPINEDEEILKTGLHDCLSTEANLDQTHIQFFQDLVYSMFDEGVVAAVPVKTTLSPERTGGYDINTLRVGRITQWFPKNVEVELYNDDTGMNERLFLEKKYVAIVENPLYAVVNDQNSTLKRLIRKLNQLDNIDELEESRRLDLFISVPYAIKTDFQKKQAQDRIKEIEAQLASGRNGIAYLDGTEKIDQLNRPLNSQLPESIAALNQEFYNQLGLTENIFNGTATEAELRSYYTRTIDPIIDNIVSEFNRKFITKTARTQGHRIAYYRDMFKMVPIEAIANLGEVFIRNEIATSNEMRKIVGFRPSNDPKADKLFNPNMPGDKQAGGQASPKVHVPKTEDEESDDSEEE